MGPFRFPHLFFARSITRPLSQVAKTVTEQLARDSRLNSSLRSSRKIRSLSRLFHRWRGLRDRPISRRHSIERGTCGTSGTTEMRPSRVQQSIRLGTSFIFWRKRCVSRNISRSYFPCRERESWWRCMRLSTTVSFPYLDQPFLSLLVKLPSNFNQ